MTTMDGSTFPAGPFMTTTDALQLTSYYCQDNFDWNPKPMTHCQKPDLLGVYRPLFLDRVCDGRIDCEGREKNLRFFSFFLLMENVKKSEFLTFRFMNSSEFKTKMGH